MSRKLGVRKNDGLDLLLDTICNAFGSIILIALLIVVISSDRSPEVQKPPMDHDEVQRRIRTAENDIARLEETVIDPTTTGKLAFAVESLEVQVETAKQMLAEAKKNLLEERDLATWDYSAAVTEIADTSRQLVDALSRLQNEIATADARILELKSYAESLNASIGKEIDNRTQQLRLPKEHATKKKPLNTIFIYNEIYPVKVFQNGNWSPNDALTTIPLDQDAVHYEPIRGRGMALPTDISRIKSLIQSSSGNEYFVCYVLPDSIGAFQKFRKEVQDAGRELGWEPLLEIRDLNFSTEGTSPNPQ